MWGAASSGVSSLSCHPWVPSSALFSWSCPEYQLHWCTFFCDFQIWRAGYAMWKTSWAIKVQFFSTNFFTCLSALSSSCHVIISLSGSFERVRGILKGSWAWVYYKKKNVKIRTRGRPQTTMDNALKLQSRKREEGESQQPHHQWQAAAIWKTLICLL